MMLMLVGSQTKPDFAERLEAAKFVTVKYCLFDWSVRQEATDGTETPEKDDVHQLDRAQQIGASVKRLATNGTETPERDDVHQLDRAQHVSHEATDGTETPERDDVHQLDRAQQIGASVKRLQTEKRHQRGTTSTSWTGHSRSVQQASLTEGQETGRDEWETAHIMHGLRWTPDVDFA
ncbi:hypothetical protein ACOMHN_005240 [Nucella lapillus]